MNIPSFSFASGILALALVAGPTAATAQTTATTGPLGYYTFTAPAGTSMWVCGLVAKSNFSGAMTGVTAGNPNSTIQQAGAGWTPGEFSNHYVEIRSGVWEGLVLDVVSNGADSLVVQGNVGAGGFNLAGNENYGIRAHATLGTLFPGGGGLGSFSDSVRLFFSNGSDATFLYNGTNWIDGSFANADAQVVYPGQGMVLSVGAPRSITFGGNALSTVKVGPTYVMVYSGTVNLIGAINPLVTTDVADPLFGRTVPMGADDLNTGSVVENGVGAKDAFTPFGDSLRLFARDGVLTDLGTYLYNGSNMIDGSFTNADSTGIAVGGAFNVSVGADKLIKIPSFVP